MQLVRNGHKRGMALTVIIIGVHYAETAGATV